MRFSGLVIGLIALAVCVALAAAPLPVHAQYQPPSERLLIRGRTASTWSEDGTDVALVEGPVVIELDRATLSARQAVVWLTPDPENPDDQRAEVVLLGDAKVDQQDAQRSGERLYVTGAVRGPIRITAEDRQTVNRNTTPLYRTAVAVRRASRPAPEGVEPEPAPVPADRAAPAEDEPVREPAPREEVPPEDVPPPPRTGRTQPRQPQSRPERAPAARPARREVPPAAEATGPVEPGATPRRPAQPAAPAAPAAPKVGTEPVLFQAPDLRIETHDGKFTVLLTQGVTLIQRRANGDMIELQADKAVVFTPLTESSLKKKPDIKQIQDAVTAVYLEGDVRVVYTPAGGPVGEQRLRARRVYYEFTTDRAVLTNAVIHTVEPSRGLPVVVRAKTVRQLALGEYKAEKIELSTSQFARPSFSIAADRIYVRSEDTGNPRLGNRISFNASNAFFKTFGVPLFWLPYAGGSLTERGFPLRSFGIENSRRYGAGFRSQWGLYESLGLVPPADLDAWYRVDYFGDRGPAVGFGGDYSGGFLTNPGKERWAFEGELDSYFLRDTGFDSFGRLGTRLDEDPEWRDHALWLHQHFFPDNWQAQVRAGYLSDATFLEEWFEREFEQGLPHDVSLYLKRQEDTEAFTFLVQFQPNNLVTTADLLQEQFEVERLPEIGYHRIGDSLFNDRLTLFSENTVSALRFNRTGASLREQGFPEDANPGPGIPSLGQTGTTGDVVYRGDFRQEVDMPFTLGQFRVVPYVVGRLTSYSDQPGGGTPSRFFGAAGARVKTSFYAIDNSIESRLFDLHRIRHVIEPEVHVFTAGTTVDRTEVYIYDEDVDAINDVSAVQFALRQRWQTKRGGPGRWRSVDVFSLGLEANFFANEPPEELLEPLGFRGLFFPSLPEASIPRDSINADILWRISDATAIIGDASYNLDEAQLATASIGMVVRRDDRMTYFVGNRYIEELDSNITSVFGEYDLSPKYSIAASQSYDFGLSENVSSAVEVRRKFDQFFMSFKLHYNERDNQSGFSFNIFPVGFGYGLDTDQLESAFNEE